ncbi:MAG: AmmeMemoRadiSam system protein A [Thaumarchaeota archaeon]|nr:AmmeMemoRadiSam system protein A [Nitrososphaerota archaeon]
MRAPEISDADGAAIVAAARQAIAEALGAPHGPAPPVPCLRAGVFVTVHGRTGLRGCIGFMGADAPLGGTLREAAVAAATGDARFAPLTAAELGSVTIEVSVLSGAEPLAGPREGYPAAVRVGRDGLVVRRGALAGLLLPQVATEMSWNAAEFLDGACQKAGLGPGCWRDEQVEVLSFAAAVFGEGSPGARAVRA